MLQLSYCTVGVELSCSSALAVNGDEGEGRGCCSYHIVLWVLKCHHCANKTIRTQQMLQCLFYLGSALLSIQPNCSSRSLARPVNTS